MIKRVIRSWIMAFIHPRPLIGFAFLPKFFFQWLQYRRNSKELLRYQDMQPCLGDWVAHTPFDPHYFYQGAWVARRLRVATPNEHIDIASSVLTISVLSAFIKTTFVDYRPLKANLEGLNSIPGDILNLPFADSSVLSLSCLHVIEHIGLGRYGDPINSKGSQMACNELKRVMASEGNLYLSLPIGRERVCFNAHRVHSPLTIINLFEGMSLINFSYVDDEGVFHQNAPIHHAENLDYGCGCFHFQKI